MLATLAIILTFILFAQNFISVSNTKCELKINPESIEMEHPRLSWVINSYVIDIRQTAYHILVSDSWAKLKKNIGNIWDSKVMKSDHSIQVEYAGLLLSSEIKKFWKVKVLIQTEKATVWSETATCNA
jgi:alpha-L-rhamnosidase